MATVAPGCWSCGLRLRRLPGEGEGEDIDVGVAAVSSGSSDVLTSRVCFPNRMDIRRSDGSFTSDTRFAARVLFHSSACSSGISGAV